MRRKQFFVLYESDRFDRKMWNRETGEYGCNLHEAGNASTLRSAKAIIGNIRRNHADENPRNFSVYDCWAEVDPATNFVPCVYAED